MTRTSRAGSARVACLTNTYKFILPIDAMGAVHAWKTGTFISS